MRVRLLGRVGQTGGIEPSVVFLGTDHVVVVVHWRGTSTLVGLRLRETQVERLWSRAFGAPPPHTWQGHPVVLNVPSLLPAEDFYLSAVGGNERLLLDARSGEVLVSNTVSRSPTAPATRSGRLIVVPEGQSVTGYDSTTLEMVFERPTPTDFWAFAPVAYPFVGVEHGSGETASVCQLESGECWTLPDTSHVRAYPWVDGGQFITPSGTGPPDRLTAFALESGALMWSAELSHRDAMRPPEQGRAPLYGSAIGRGEHVLVASDLPALDARLRSTGALIWRVPLPARPTTLRGIDEAVWVGCADGTVTVVALDGQLIATLKLASSTQAPVAIFPAAGGILVVTQLGDVLRVSVPH